MGENFELSRDFYHIVEVKSTAHDGSSTLALQVTLVVVACFFFICEDFW